MKKIVNSLSVSALSVLVTYFNKYGSRTGQRNANYETIRIVCVLSLVNSCVKIRVCKHRSVITRILIGYVLSDVPSFVKLFLRNIL